MPPRRGTRGILPAVLTRAEELAKSRLRFTMDYLDRMTDTGGLGPFGGGGAIKKADHLLLLANDPAYQSAQLAKIPYMNADEVKQLQRDIAAAQALMPATPPPSTIPPTAEQLL